MNFLDTSSSKKRSSTESSTSAQDPKRVKSGETEEVAIGVRTWSKLWAKLEQAERYCDFPDRLHHLQGRCTVLDKTSCSMWIEFDTFSQTKAGVPLYLLFTLKKRACNSESLPTELLCDFPKQKNQFYEISLEELRNEGTREELLKIIVSPSGNKGELAWIASGEKFSGKSILGIFERAQQYLRIRTLYLYDDAKFKFNSSTTLTAEISLEGHHYIPIAAPGGTPFYVSWANFKIFNCKNIPHVQKENLKFNQNEEKYRDAISFLKNLKVIDDFRNKILRGYPSWQRKVDTLLKKIGSKFPLKESPNLEQLISTANANLRASTNPQKKYAMALLLNETIHLFLRYNPGKSANGNKLIKNYVQATHQLEFTRIFVREW